MTRGARVDTRGRGGSVALPPLGRGAPGFGQPLAVGAVLRGGGSLSVQLERGDSVAWWLRRCAEQLSAERVLIVHPDSLLLRGPWRQCGVEDWARIVLSVSGHPAVPGRVSFAAAERLGRACSPRFVLLSAVEPLSGAAWRFVERQVLASRSALLIVHGPDTRGPLGLGTSPLRVLEWEAAVETRSLPRGEAELRSARHGQEVRAEALLSGALEALRGRLSAARRDAPGLVAGLERDVAALEARLAVRRPQQVA